MSVHGISYKFEMMMFVPFFLMAVYCVGFEQGNILSSPTWGLEMVPYQSRSIDRVRV